jgi:tRNA-splicing ligase RtcB
LHANLPPKARGSRSSLATSPSFEFRRSKILLDEIPSAYEDIDEVMEHARSLVAVRHVLKQFLNVKGD